MKNHVKVYIEYYNLAPNSYIRCEICSSSAVDIHHIESRGMGGSKKKDNIENLIAVCRKCHERCHSDEIFNSSAKNIHLKNL